MAGSDLNGRTERELLTEQLSRTERLLGSSAMARLAQSHVIVFGLGGVGGHAAEALVRSGIGALTLVDSDTVALSNLNRQIFATRDTVGMDKVDAAAERLLRINPSCRITRIKLFYLPETKDRIPLAGFDYAVDAIDTVKGKLTIIQNAREAGVPVISCMGAGNKLDPTAFRVADLYETAVCPLAKVMRRECRKMGIDTLKVVYSTEMPHAPEEDGAEDAPPGRRQVPASAAFVPAAAGLILAGEVIRDLAAQSRRQS